jgi:hypothetical protein
MLASIVAAVMIVLAIIFFAITQVPKTYVRCTESDTYVYFGPTTISVPPTAQTETTVRSFTTATNSPAIVGYTAFTNFTIPFPNGNELTARYCTYAN